MKKILEHLKSEYENLEIKPSANLWNKISETQKIFEPASKRSFEWWKYAAAVLILISFGSVFYFETQDARHETQDIGHKMQNVRFETQNLKFETENRKPDENPVKILNAQNADKIERNENINPVSGNNFSKNQTPEKDEIIEEKILNETPKMVENINIENIEEPKITERKKANYVKADELLLGRALDKTRDENADEQKHFGIIDINNLKIKSPNSLKILGITVYSDSAK
ncbi:MAG: hypothetical protein LBE36_07210 [Flavobacteriaceae bacterium]|jgi:hypothetical protein|nr:hypothetical protein [Flavobacteriaceae bacterium]